MAYGKSNGIGQAGEHANNGAPLANPIVDQASEEHRSRELAQRYRCEFIHLRDYKIDPELFRSIPVDLMFRYNFEIGRAHV